MALDIPKHKEIFRQRDVRETEARFTPGEGIDISADKIISGEDATTTNKGIASFNTDDFSASSGAISLKNKTSYLSLNGADFLGTTPDTDDIYLTETAEGLLIQTGVVDLIAAVHLPHGAIVTGCIVYGNAGATGETWSLDRCDRMGGSLLMASAAVGTEDTTITEASINNSSYSYDIVIQGLDTNDVIWGARITYTTDYI